MSDTSGQASDETPSGPSRGIIAIIAAIVVAGLVAAVFFLAGDDDDADEDVTTTSAPDTAPVTEAPPATEAPETAPSTEGPPETEAPPETDAPPQTEAPTTTAPAPVELSFTIRDIPDGGEIPIDFTCDGANQPPTVVIEAIPDGVLQLAMLVDDPDAPTPEPFVHWVVYNIAGDAEGFTDADPAATYGTNDVQLTEWFGPCPPEGDGAHGYVFALYGLDRELQLDPGLSGSDLLAAIDGSVVVESSVVASYERAST